jgi:hypothetical protein
MKLSEWRERPTISIDGELWARATVAEAADTLGSSEDPVAFSAVVLPDIQRGAWLLTLWAALSTGLARIAVGVVPGGDSTIEWSVEPWPSLAATLRLASSGDVEDRRRPVVLMVGGQRIESGRTDQAELTELFRECARRAGRS